MFRAAIVSIVLTLIVGPNTALLCSVWCHPEEATTSTCQHQNATTSPRVTGQARCGAPPANATAFVRQEARRGSPTNDAQYVFVVGALRFAFLLTDASQADGASRSLSAEGPPRLIALRI